MTVYVGLGNTTKSKKKRHSELVQVLFQTSWARPGPILSTHLYLPARNDAPAPKCYERNGTEGLRGEFYKKSNSQNPLQAQRGGNRP